MIKLVKLPQLRFEIANILDPDTDEQIDVLKCYSRMNMMMYRDGRARSFSHLHTCI